MGCFAKTRKFFTWLKQPIFHEGLVLPSNVVFMSDVAESHVLSIFVQSYVVHCCNIRDSAQKSPGS